MPFRLPEICGMTHPVGGTRSRSSSRTRLWRRSCSQAEKPREAIAERSLPQLYFEREAVASAGEGDVIQPLAMYTDGVGFHRHNSVLGVWVYHLLTGGRHLVVVLRKAEICNCGCRGWCSLAPLWTCLAWSFAHMLRGYHPLTRHDGTGFTEADGSRAAVAGEPLGFRAVVLLLKCDIAEQSHSLGLPGGGDSVAPCPFCFAEPRDMFDTSGFSALGVSNPKRTLAQYLSACQKCEVAARVRGRFAQIQLRAALAYDKTKSGSASKGRALQTDFPEYGLLRRDRLEPRLGLMDVASFDEHAVPFTAVFWRVSLETATRHRNPLFSTETGLCQAHIGIDWLHTLSLGVFQMLLCELIWDMFLANCYQIGGTQTNRVELSVARFRAELVA